MKIDAATVIAAIELSAKLVQMYKDTREISSLKDEAQLSLAVNRFMTTAGVDVARVSAKLEEAGKKND